MTIQELGNLGEFISSIAVVVSLVYLAIQIRHNSAQMQENIKALRRGEINETMRGFSNLRSLLIASDTFTDLLVRAETDPTALSESERLRVLAYFREWIWLNYHTWSRSREGYMERSDRPARLIAQVLSTPLGKEAWEASRSSFEETFAREVESHTDELAATGY